SQKFNQLSDILADVRKLSLNIVSVNEPKINKKAIQNADLLVAPGAGIYMFYPRASNTRNYTKYLSLEELSTYLQKEKGDPVNLVATLLQAEGTARVYIRTGKNSILVLEPGGSKGLITRKIDGTDRSFKYKIDGNIDPLGYQNDSKANMLLDGGFHSAEKWFENTYHTQYPFQIDQIFRYMDCKNVGHLIAEAKKGWNYVATGLEDEDEKVQNHDTCDRDEIMVPLIISGTDIRKGFEIPYCRNVDIIPTFLDWLKLGYNPLLLDGRPLKEIFLNKT
ncbi:MAG: hypothetical protein ACTSQ8_21305, partial [Candidatus Helarchaeota archaeon]